MADKTIYLGKMLYDEWNDQTWGTFTSGVGGLDKATLSDETSIIKHGYTSKKIVVGAGGVNKYYSGGDFSFASEDWEKYLYLYLYVYSTVATDLRIRLETGGSPAEWTSSSHGGTGWEFFAFDLNNPDSAGGAFDLGAVDTFVFAVTDVGTYYVDFICVGCELDFVVDYRRKRTSKIALHKIAGGVSRRDTDSYVRDRGYVIKARINRTIDSCLEGFDDSKEYLGLDDGVRLDTVWMDTFESHEQSGFENTHPVMAMLNLLVSAC